MSTPFDSRSIFLPNLSSVTNIRFDGVVSETGNPLIGQHVITYSVLAFELGGLTYYYEGTWETEANRLLVLGSVTASGTYDTVRVVDGTTEVANMPLPGSLTVDFGTVAELPLSALLGNLLDCSSG
jgi:hypothetical protein